MTDQIYNFAAWQKRMNLSREQAAHALDVSPSFYSKLKRDGTGRKLYAWAAHGLECARDKTPKTLFPTPTKMPSPKEKAVDASQLHADTSRREEHTVLSELLNAVRKLNKKLDDNT